MSGGIPLYGYVAGAVLWMLALIIGMWAGYGRGWAHCEEEMRWRREQARARRSQWRMPAAVPPEVAHEAWRAHEEQALALANGCGWCRDPYCTGQHETAITTGEIQAITEEMDAWLAVHVYAAPTDYGAFIEQAAREERR